ncbi:MAG: hypothetical protein HY226_02970 [Candidatus Vogelbacteria bacterium]|nr:hypothetical protein [Candidatus Vogelbacteria bacterium]
MLGNMKRKTLETADKYPASKLLLGVIFLILGLIGFALPIMPGWPFFVVGCELLGIKLLFVDRILFYLKLKKQKSSEETSIKN